MERNIGIPEPESENSSTTPVEGSLPRFFPMIPAAEKRSGIFSRRDILPSLALAIGSAAVGGQFYADDPIFFYRSAVEFVGDHNCMTVSEDATSRVRITLEEPDDRRLVNGWKRLDKAYKSGNLERIHRSFDRIRSYVVERATVNGLELIDSDEHLDQVDEAENIEDVLTILNNFGANFGLSFGIPREKPIADFLMEYDVIDSAELDLAEVKILVKNALSSLSYLPVELVRLANPRRVVFVRNIEKSKFNETGYEILGETESRAGIYMNYDASLDPDNFAKVFAHELAHKIDFVICGQFGSKQDEELKELNPQGRKYKTNYQNSEGFTLTEYGATSILEDKAEMMGNMFYQLLNPSEMPDAVGEKYGLVLARLEDNIPGISKYLREISIFGSGGKA